MRLIDAEQFDGFGYDCPYKEEKEFEAFNDGVTFVLEKLDAAPTVDAQPVVHAKWEIVENEEHRTIGKCPNCKEWLMLYYNFLPNYCPHCGAKMDKEK